MNALEHAECSELFLDIWNEKNGKLLNVVIKDNGVGFNVENVLNTVKNHFGLKIVKERIELIGGTFEIESFEEKGTKVTITVPVVLEGENKNER